MLRALPIAEWLAAGTPMLDVRSPGEFARGHIPGAVNVPLFSDAERATVGTLYKQQGRDIALLEGLRIVGPKLATLVEQARAVAPDGRVRVHCWRGGERSGSVAWLLDKAGFADVHSLKGGYKAFRRHVLEALEQPPTLHVLGGFTGSGKTELLHQLRAAGAPVIDLEALAHHKGSSFGMLGEAPQPTQEHFENQLWKAAQQAPADRPIWVEDESRQIGRVNLPMAWYAAMQGAPLLFVEVEQPVRVARLVQDYGHFPTAQLAEAITRIAKRLGPQHAKAALEALDAGDLDTVARITLTYYDKAYAHSTAQRDPARIEHVPMTDDLAQMALRLIHDHSTQPIP